MEIVFSNSKLQKACNSQKECIRKYGLENARKIMQRLAELQAAETLADISTLPPPRCHELTGEREGEFAVDVKQPHRIVFVPNHDPTPLNEEGGIDRNKVTKIRILEITDYH